MNKVHLFFDRRTVKRRLEVPGGVQPIQILVDQRLRFDSIVGEFFQWFGANIAGDVLRWKMDRGRRDLGTLRRGRRVVEWMSGIIRRIHETGLPTYLDVIVFGFDEDQRFAEIFFEYSWTKGSRKFTEHHDGRRPGKRSFGLGELGGEQDPGSTGRSLRHGLGARHFRRSRLEFVMLQPRGLLNDAPENPDMSG